MNDLDNSILTFPDNRKSLALFHINACSLNRSFDYLDHLLSENRITKQTSLTSNINLKKYAIEFTSTLLVTYLINQFLILIFIKLIS